MANCVFGERRRSRVAELVGGYVFVGQITDSANALLTDVLDVIEALLKFAPAFLLSSLCERF